MPTSHRTPAAFLLPVLLAGGACAGIATAQQATFEFTNSGQALGDRWSNSVALGDLDGDGDLDAFVTNYAGLLSNANPGDTVWMNDGNGIFTDSGQSLGDSLGLSVALGDLDGDGDLDAMVANSDIHWAPNTVWMNDGSGTFTDSGQALGQGDSYAVALGDLDGDGDLDAFVTNTGQQNTVWINDGTGLFTDSGQRIGDKPPGEGFSWGVALGDLDGDGDLDAMVVDSNSTEAMRGNTVWTNNGKGVFTDSGQRLGTSNSASVALGDLDGDGDLDAMVANRFSPDRIWMNDGTGTFTNSGQALGDSKSISVALGDLDGDGDLDAMVADKSTRHPNTVWINDGNATFTNSGQELGKVVSTSVALGDLEGDGKLDAMVANQYIFKQDKDLPLDEKYRPAPNTVWKNTSK